MKATVAVVEVCVVPATVTDQLAPEGRPDSAYETG
jgi:hypothetical protein